MHRMKLATVLAAGPGVIFDIGQRLARREVILDGQGVAALAPDQLA